MKVELVVQYCVALFSVIITAILSTASYVDSEMKRPTVEVHQGQLQGIREENVDGNSYFYAFRGIPYAQPPIGELRFKDPDPPGPWLNVKDAEEFGSVCAQYDWRTRDTLGSEDCLFLNVYTKELNPDAPRAVMVWIHGGGFYSGSGNDDAFGPDYLVEKGVIIVTINYRLGILGFLNLDDESASGNQGLKDQVMALRWVQQNIAKFGGDPKKVTIFGESAGAASVHYLTLSPLAQGLFDKAIIQSGVATNPWASISSPMEEAAENIADKLGNKVTDTKQLIEYFRSVEAHSLIETEKSFKTWRNFYQVLNPFVPSVDSKSKDPFLNVPIQEAAKSGIKVPHIIGYTNDEGVLFISKLQDEQYSEIAANQEELLIPPNEKRFLQEQNVSVDDFRKFFMGTNEIARKNAKKFAELIGAGMFTVDIHNVLKMQSSIPDVPTYLYKFNYYSKDTSVMQKLMRINLEGTCHLEDLVYLFYSKLRKSIGIEPPALGTTEYLIKQRFVQLWTNFAKTGNPNSGISELIPIEWKPVDDSTEYNCLEISKDPSLIKASNVLEQILQSS